MRHDANGKESVASDVGNCSDRDHSDISDAGSETKPSFEVATIKANTRLGPSSLNKVGDRFVATALPLRPLIMEAYRVRDFQILGGPRWINDDQWDIEAKAEPDVRTSPGRNPRIHTGRVRWPGCCNLDRESVPTEVSSGERENSGLEVTIARRGSKLSYPRIKPRQWSVTRSSGGALSRSTTQPFRQLRLFLRATVGSSSHRQDGVEGSLQRQIAMDTGTNRRHAGIRFSNTLHRRTGTARIETGIGQGRNRHVGHRQRAAAFRKLTLRKAGRAHQARPFFESILRSIENDVIEIAEIF